MKEQKISSLRGAAARALLLATTILGYSGAACAQSAGAPSTATSAAGQAPAAQQSDSSDIIVTAQRREERLQDVPAAISAFTGSTLERRNVQDSTDLARLSPGLRLDNSGFVAQPTLRGIGSRSLSPGEESTVPIFIDGVYLPFPTGNAFQLQNIERVEVLKGPQGALYGRNATGGAINIITALPQLGFHSALEASYGRFNDILLKGLVEGGSETLRASLSLSYRNSDGYLHDILTNSTAGGEKDFDARLKVVLSPTSNLRFTLGAGHAYLNDLTGSAYEPLNGNTAGLRSTPPSVIATGPYQVALGAPVGFANKIDSVSLTAKWDLGGVSLTALTSYLHLASSLQNSTTAAVKIGTVYTGFSNNYGDAYYNEAYFQSNNSSNFHWIVGGTYYHVSTGYLDQHLWSQNVATNGWTFSSFKNYVTSRAIAIYAQATLDVGDHLSLIVAGRYTTETAAIHRRDFISGAVPSFGVYLTTPTSPNADAEKTFHNFSPSATLQYKVSESLNFYVKVGKGFKSGVFSPGGTSLLAANPEHITQYEGGLKAKLAPGTYLTIAGYHSDYSDIQVQARDPITGLAILQNASSARINGGEIELTSNPMRNLSLNAGLSVTDGHYSSFPGAVVYFPLTTSGNPTPSTSCVAGTGTAVGGNRQAFCDVTGNRLIRVPVWQATLGGYYEVALSGGSKIGLSANLEYESSYYWDALNRLQSPARTLVDSEISFTPAGIPVTFSIWGKNLLNEFYYRHASAGSSADTVVPQRPRTYGVRLRAKF